MKKLSKAQLSVLGQLATKAHRRLMAVGVLDAGLPADKYDPWRHTETAEQCGGIASWRALDQSHYVPLCNRFRAYIGLKPKQDNTPKDDAAALIWTLRDRLQFWDASPAYVAAIVRDKTGRTWVTASTGYDAMFSGLDCRALKQLLYTFESRFRAREKKAAAALNIPAPAEIHTSPSTMPPARLAAHRGDILSTRLPSPCRASATPQPADI